MCASARNVTVPNPPPPHPVTCVASQHVFETKESQWRSIQHVCKSERNILLRSIKNVCKCKERYCPQPTPPHHLRSISHVFETKESQWRSIQHVCKSERNILLRSIKNVCKCKERYCPQPTPPHPHHLRSISHVFETKESQWRGIQRVCKSERNILLRSIKNVCKCKERYCPQPTPPHPTKDFTVTKTSVSWARFAVRSKNLSNNNIAVIIII